LMSSVKAANDGCNPIAASGDGKTRVKGTITETRSTRSALSQ
jgi:hypothetical protein